MTERSVLQLMRVSGSGKKTTIGALLADRLGWSWLAVVKMAAGHPLTTPTAGPGWRRSAPRSTNGSRPVGTS
jgi:hypothetical protein